MRVCNDGHNKPAVGRVSASAGHQVRRHNVIALAAHIFAALQQSYVLAELSYYFLFPLRDHLVWNSARRIIDKLCAGYADII